MNDDGVLDRGSDWFKGIWAKPEMEDLTIQNQPFNLNTINELMKIEKIYMEFFYFCEELVLR